MTGARLGDANAHWLTDHLAAGGGLNAFDEDLADDQLRSLVAAGITHVVDLRAPRDEISTWPESSRFEVLQAGTVDDGSTKPAGWFASFVPWALAALDDPATACWGTAPWQQPRPEWRLRHLADAGALPPDLGHGV